MIRLPGMPTSRSWAPGMCPAQSELVHDVGGTVRVQLTGRVRTASAGVPVPGAQITLQSLSIAHPVAGAGPVDDIHAGVHGSVHPLASMGLLRDTEAAKALAAEVGPVPLRTVWDRVSRARRLLRVSNWVDTCPPGTPRTCTPSYRVCDPQHRFTGWVSVRVGQLCTPADAL